MAIPENDIIVIAQDPLGGDGYTNKEEPNAPVTLEGYGVQGLPYQQLNYMIHNHGVWLKYIRDEKLPEDLSDLENLLQDQIDIINNITIPDEVQARIDGDQTLQNSLTNHVNNSNPHSDSQASSDWSVTTGVLSNGATIPIPAGFALGDCTIFAMQEETYNGNWDLDEDVTVNHYRNICRVVGGVLESNCRVWPDGLDAYQTFPVDARYVVIARKGVF